MPGDLLAKEVVLKFDIEKFLTRLTCHRTSPGATRENVKVVQFCNDTASGNCAHVGFCTGNLASHKT